MTNKKVLLISFVLMFIVFVMRAFTTPVALPDSYSYSFTTNTLLLIILGIIFLFFLGYMLYNSYIDWSLSRNWKTQLSETFLISIIYSLALSVLGVFKSTGGVNSIEWQSGGLLMNLIVIGLGFLGCFGLLVFLSGLYSIKHKKGRESGFVKRIMIWGIVWLVVGGVPAFLLMFTVIGGRVPPIA